MRRFKLSDNTRVYIGSGFAYGGVQYGSNWFAELTPEQKAAIGLEEYVQAPPPDGRFYFASEDPANPGQWITSDRPLEQIKAMFKAQVNQYVASTLAQTDWMRLRAIDDDTKPMPANVATYRNAIRDHGNTLVAEMEAIEAFADLIAWTPHDWPELGEEE